MMSEEAGESVNKFLKASVTSVVKFQVAELIDIRFLPMILCRAKVVIPSIIKLHRTYILGDRKWTGLWQIKGQLISE